VSRVPAVNWRHPALWLVLILAAGIAAGIHYVLKLKGYYIMPDELTYQREAIMIAHKGRPLVSGDPYYNSPSELAPILHAPIWGLIGSIGTAIDASHVLNAIVFASACIPIYLLTRRITGSVVASLLAGAATVAVPWFAISATMMTEPVAYTAFCWGALAVHHAIARPGPLGDVIGLAGVVLALQGRSQLVVLGATLVVGIVAREAIAARREGVAAALRRHYVLLAVAGLTVLFLLVTGKSPNALIGNYGVATHGDLLPPGTFPYARELMTSAGLACGVIALPLAASWGFSALGRPRDEEPFAGAIVVVVTTALLAVVVAAYSVRFTAGQNDRYISYVAPLLFTGTAAAFTVGPLRLVPTAIAAVATAWLYWTSTLVLLGPSLVAPGSAFRTVLDGRSRVIAGHLGFSNADPTAVLAVVGTVAVAVVLLALRRLRVAVVGLAVGVVVLGYGIAETAYTFHKVAPTSVNEDFFAGRGWADRALPSGQKLNAFVSLIGDSATTVGVWWDAVFYNLRVDRVYLRTNGPNYNQTAPGGVAVDTRTGSITGLPGGYLLAPSQPVDVGLADVKPLATNGPVSLIRVPSVPRAAFSFDSNAGAGQVGIDRWAPLRVYGLGHAARRVVRFTAVARLGPIRLDIADERGRRLDTIAMQQDVPTTVTRRVAVPATGVTQLRIAVEKATGAANADAYLQALGITVVDR
jgi:hypothetical protein